MPYYIYTIYKMSELTVNFIGTFQLMKNDRKVGDVYK